MPHAAECRQTLRDLFLPEGCEGPAPARFRTAARVRLAFIIPLLYGFTLLCMLSAGAAVSADPVYKALLAAWIALACGYAAANLSTLALRGARSGATLAYACIALELMSNEIVIYLTGVTNSHALIFIVVSVAVYRVFFGYAQALTAAAAGIALHALAAGLVAGGALPSPEEALPVLAAMRAARAALAPGVAASSAALAIGVVITFSTINLGMNIMHRMKEAVAAGWKKDLDSIERFNEQVLDCADEAAVWAETIRAMLYATPFSHVAILERDAGAPLLRASNNWAGAVPPVAAKWLATLPTGDNQVSEASVDGWTVRFFSLACDSGNPAWLAVAQEGRDKLDDHRRSMLLNIAQGAGGAVCSLRRIRSEHVKAYTDALTGLYNKLYFLEQLPLRVQEAADNGKQLCVAMFDIDRFKQYNDTHGHLAGDGLLRSVAQTIRGTLRGEDIAVRFGGEEFVVLFAGADPVRGAAAAERVRAAVEEAHRSAGVTVSGGAAFWPLDAHAAGELVDRADRRLYKAKNAGRNRICCS